MASGLKRSLWRASHKRPKGAQWLALEREKRLAQAKEQLFTAAVNGDVETALRVLAGGIDVNTTDENYLTPLHYAAMHAKPQVIEALIDHGAHVDATDIKGGFTPMHWVVINAQPGLAETGKIEECLIALARGGCNVNCKDYNQATPLHFAARTNNRAVVDVLMRLEADPNETDVSGRTCAAVAKSEETKVLIIKLADLRARATYHVLEIPPTVL